MDRIDVPAPESFSPASPLPATPPRSQSRLSPVLLWVLVAAVLFRIVTAVVNRGPADGPGLVVWQSHAKAASLAAASGKPILYEFSAAWCGPCKLLDRDWEDAGIAARVNGGYIAARVIDRQREDGRNPPDVDALMRRYEVTGFPSLVAASPDGRLLGKLVGYAGPERLRRFLEDPAANASP